MTLIVTGGGCQPLDPTGNRMSSTQIVRTNSAPPTHPVLAAYDEELISTAERRWYDLLDTLPRGAGKTEPGKVVLKFRLHADGTVSDVKAISGTVDEGLTLLCFKALTDPAPYRRWPAEMRALFKQDYREMEFSFTYGQPEP
ncbi:MAG: hypothetical protein H7Y43_05925 [Akkermansiaceae bacterium]|nr:hypothetical protein [Verrucomicrobiales bacterium]